MGVEVATTCLQWSQPVSSSHTLISSLKLRSFSDRAFVFQYSQRFDSSAFYRRNLYRKSRAQTIKRACSASLDAFSDEEFSKKIQELAMRFELSKDDYENTNSSRESECSDSAKIRNDDGGDICNNSISQDSSELNSTINFVENQIVFWTTKIDAVEPPDWPGRDEIIPVSIERKANSVNLPLSLRIIKKKKQWQEGFRGAGESAYCSVNKAFSSMVFIIRELHSVSLQMREMLFYEDLQGIWVRVQKEMHAYFVWLFQHVFSHTPTLMVYVMILLANYSVHSLASNCAIAAIPPPQSYAATTESVSVFEDQSQGRQKFDSSAIKTFSASSSSGKTSTVGGNNGGGGKFRPASSGTDGEGLSNGSLNFHPTILPDGVSSIGNPTTREDESVPGQVAGEEEVSLWNSTVEEATRMQAALKDEALDHETMQSFVSPVTAKIEEDDYAEYLRTELLYQTGLAQEPNNPLLLANYAQFLYLVAHNYDRAEEYFKRAVEVEPPDAEALSKYASFLWLVRKDLWAAEETYLKAISSDPTNSYYAANYAHFLWTTGGQDTCFPIPDKNVNDT